MSPRDAQTTRKQDVKITQNDEVDSAEVILNGRSSDVPKLNDRTEAQQRVLASAPSTALNGVTSMMGPSTYDPFIGNNNYMYGGGGMGYGGIGMSPYMMSGGMGMMTGHPGITNVLSNFQQIMFSISQAIQIVGMNAEALRQMVNAFKDLSMKLNESVREFVNAVNKQLAIESKRHQSSYESLEQKKRRRRLKVLRWTMALVGSYAIYRSVKKMFFGKRRHRDLLTNYDGFSDIHRRSTAQNYAHEYAGNSHSNRFGGGSSYQGHSGTYY